MVLIVDQLLSGNICHFLPFLRLNMARQKQSLKGVQWKTYSEKFHKKTPMAETLFRRVSYLQLGNLLKEIPQRKLCWQLCLQKTSRRMFLEGAI